MSRPARITAGSRELKTRLGAYLDMVRHGTVVTVTDRGKPVARLSPIPEADTDTEAALERLAEQGILTRPTQSSRPVAERVALVETPGPALSETVDQEREDRF